MISITDSGRWGALHTDSSDTGDRVRSFALGILPYAKAYDGDAGPVKFGLTQCGMHRLRGYCDLIGADLALDPSRAPNSHSMLARSYEFQQRKKNAYAKSVGLQPAGLATTPWSHQRAGIYVASGGSPVYYAMGMGTGKSLTTVGACCELKHRRILVLCPRSVLRVWPREFGNHAPGVFSVCSLEGGSMAKKVETANHAYQMTPGPLVIAINYDSYRQPAFSKWATSQKWDLVVCDESHRAKSPFGVTSKAIHKLYGVSGQRFCLSGTPMPHDPLDIWSQCAFLDPGLFGTSFTRFRTRYAKIGFFKNVEGFVNQEELSELFSTIAFHVSSDVIDLPPVTHSYRTFALEPKTMKAYETFRRKLAAEIEGGLMTAANALVKSIRLQQMTSGFYVNDDGEKVDLNDRTKEKTLEEMIGEDVAKGEKVVVFTRFHRDLDAVAAVAERCGLRYGELSGRRNDLDDKACYPQDVDVFGVNIASGGVGVDLTAASHAVLYSLSWSAAEYDQALKRLHRPGQKSHVTFTHLVAEGTIDEAIYEAIRCKRDLSDRALHDTVISSIIGK